MYLYNILKDEYEKVKDEALDAAQNARNSQELTKAEGMFEGVEALWEAIEIKIRELLDV